VSFDPTPKHGRERDGEVALFRFDGRNIGAWLGLRRQHLCSKTRSLKSCNMHHSCHDGKRVSKRKCERSQQRHATCRVKERGVIPTCRE
jgi:hypothetical protein